MNLYRFRGYGWGAASWHIVAPTFYDAWTTAEAEGIRWCDVELLASDDDATWPEGAPKKRLIVHAPPAAPENPARIADLERKLAELTAEKDAAIAAEAKRAQEAERERDKFSADLCDEVRRKCELKEQLRELTAAAEEMFRAYQHLDPLEECLSSWRALRAVLDAQRGEKEEAKS